MGTPHPRTLEHIREAYPDLTEQQVERLAQTTLYGAMHQLRERWADLADAVGPIARLGWKGVLALYILAVIVAGIIVEVAR